MTCRRQRIGYYAVLLPRRGPHIALHSVCPSVCLSVRLFVRLSVCPSVCPSVPLLLPSVTSRHLANYNDTHVLFGTHRGPHIVRPSRPHKLVDIQKRAVTKGWEMSNGTFCTSCHVCHKSKTKFTTPLRERRRVLVSLSYRPWARRWRTTIVCDEWPVRRQTYGYLPSRKVPLAGTKLYCLVTEAHVC